MNPYITFAKLGAGIVIVFAILFAGHQALEMVKDIGRNEVQEKWDAAELKRERDFVTDQLKQKLLNDARTKGVIDDYENKLAANKIAHRADVARIIAAGGLRVPTTACKGLAASSEATGAQGDYEADTTRLNEQIESDLFNYADERDQEIIQLGACQKWITDNGMFTTASPPALRQ